MPRGNFWEATFDPDWDGPGEEASMTELAGSSGLVKRRIVAADGNPVSVKWKRGDNTPRHFQKCDFQLDVRDAYVSDCKFSQCRFKDSIWRELGAMSFFVVGDIHGCSAQLRVLLEHRDLYRERRGVFLGDFVDVGPDSPGVIDLLLAFRAKPPDTVFLQGNHDVGLLTYLRSGDFAAYAEAGGIATIRAYCGEVHGDVRAALEQEMPQTHSAFLRDLTPYFETKDYLFSHCGYSPESPSDRSVEAMVLQSHQRLFENGSPLGKLAVCGHYFQRTHRPFITDRVICLDTGCGILGGPLSAVLLPDFSIVQVSTDLSLSVR